MHCHDKKSKNPYAFLTGYGSREGYQKTVQSHRNNDRQEKIQSPSPSMSNEELAEEFATFFINKIRKIRDTLYTCPTFKPTQHSNSKSLVNFTKLAEDEVAKIIMSMPTKSCKLDGLPTKVFKDIITPLLPLLKKKSLTYC